VGLPPHFKLSSLPGGGSMYWQLGLKVEVKNMKNEDKQKSKAVQMFIQKFSELTKGGKTQSFISLWTSLIISLDNYIRLGDFELAEAKTKNDLQKLNSLDGNEYFKKVFDIIKSTSWEHLTLTSGLAGYYIGIQQSRTAPDYIM
jgi:hypothetical protein